MITKIRSDGTIVEVLEDGNERLIPVPPLRPMTDEEIHSAALSDPDAHPMTTEGLRKARRVSRAKNLRTSQQKPT